MVTNVYGGGSGTTLDFPRFQQLRQTAGAVGKANDKFGYALSAWNYGRSAHADLAVGIPFKDITSIVDGEPRENAGAVIVFYGSDTGIAALRPQIWHQDTFRMSGPWTPATVSATWSIEQPAGL